MLFRGTERNQRRIFRKMLKCGTIISTTGTDIVADLWKTLGATSLLPLTITVGRVQHAAVLIAFDIIQQINTAKQRKTKICIK